MAAGCIWLQRNLPQILRRSGVDFFITSKISWNQYNRVPHDLFYWAGDRWEPDPLCVYHCAGDGVSRRLLLFHL